MASNPAGYKVCPVCHTSARLDDQFCSVCGHPYQTQFVTSPNQTQAFQGPGANPNLIPFGYADRPDSNRMLVTILLWFFVGRFGAHRFYLGHINSAILMLVLEVIGWATLCILVGWFFLIAVSIWWIIDLIQILTGNLRPVDGARLV